jgi:hypothetical protein
MYFKKDKKLRWHYEQICEVEAFYEYGDLIKEMDLKL